MWRGLKRNPFFLRSWWVWRREQMEWPLPGLWFWLLLPFALTCAWGYAWDGRVSIDAIGAEWLVIFCLFVAVLTVQAVSRTSACHSRERDLGALDAASLTATSPDVEVDGRWAGALLGVFHDWMAGWALLAVGAALIWLGSLNLLGDVDHQVLRLASFWIFVGLWCAAIGAIGLYASTVERSTTTACMRVVLTVLGFSAAYFVAVGLLEKECASPSLIACVLYLPPQPSAFAMILIGPFNAGHLLMMVGGWTAFTVIALLWAGRRIRAGYPLRVGVPPQEPLARARRRQRPPHACSRPSAQAVIIDLSEWKSPDALVHCMLAPFHCNPFYVARHQGLAHLHITSTSCPGNVLPPALMMCALLGYSALYRMELGADLAAPGAPVSGTILVGAVLVAALISSFEGATLGAQSLAMERDPARWSPLVASGVAPRTVLWGLLAANIYALSGEWSLALPFWLAAFFAGSRVGVLALALVHPACTAIGVLFGISRASSRRQEMSDFSAQVRGGLHVAPRLVLLSIALSAVMCVFVAAAPVTLVHFGIVLPLAWLNPLQTAWTMAAHSYPAVFLPALRVWLAQAAMAVALVWLLYRSTERRLAHLMRGE